MNSSNNTCPGCGHKELIVLDTEAECLHCNRTYRIKSDVGTLQSKAGRVIGTPKINSYKKGDLNFIRVLFQTSDWFKDLVGDAVGHWKFYEDGSVLVSFMSHPMSMNNGHAFLIPVTDAYTDDVVCTTGKGMKDLKVKIKFHINKDRAANKIALVLNRIQMVR